MGASIAAPPRKSPSRMGTREGTSLLPRGNNFQSKNRKIPLLRRGSGTLDKFQSGLLQDYERRYFREPMREGGGEGVMTEHYESKRPSSHLSSFSRTRSPFPTRGIIRPITLCLNIYRAALGKHEPSLCMGAQHVGSPSLSRNRPHRRHCRCTHGLPLPPSLSLSVSS